jgi:hypothetical protein
MISTELAAVVVQIHIISYLERHTCDSLQGLKGLTFINKVYWKFMDISEVKRNFHPPYLGVLF